MTARSPQRTRVYQNHHLDSTRWDVYEPRPTDIIVTTAYKAGTTWTQQILSALLHPARDPMLVHELSPWVDARFMGTSKQELRDKLAALPDRRFLKSHLALDGLPYYPEVRYIVVARDPRDVFMSLLNHWENYTDLAYSMVNSAGLVGDPFPPMPDDPREIFHNWISRGWFGWENEGWPFWSSLHHAQSYWTYRDLPNFLLLHYNDMLADLVAAVREIAAFAEIDASEADVARAVEATRFDTVKRRAEEATRRSSSNRGFFRGGAAAFFFKGTNGRWRELLTDDDLALYEQTKASVLEPDCAHWIEHGGRPPD